VTNSFSFTQAQQEVRASIAEAEDRLKSLRHELDGVLAKLNDLSAERSQYQLLDDICQSIGKLDEMGASELFWGEGFDSNQVESQLERVRGNVTQFQSQIGDIDEGERSIRSRIAEEEGDIDRLNDRLDDLLEQEERAKDDYVIEREESPLPYRPVLMPWSKQGEDERRFRKSLALVFLFVMSLSALISIWELPKPDENQVVEIPENLVKLVKKQKPKPKPPEKKKEEKPREKSEEKQASKDKPKPTAAQTKEARKKAESTGVLAFKESFSNLLADDVDAKLGASANLSNKGAKASGDNTRNLVMSQAKSTSGGINTSNLNRGVGGSAGKKLGGVGFERVTSSIGTDMAANDRPLSDGPGPSRTDEEIQIVFDRYKAALYRIYNRELRKNPSLKGKMVLRITIMPDGSVSKAKVESTDLASDELSRKIVERVKRFNFGPKAGVPATTILYPIDFLPAS